MPPSSKLRSVIDMKIALLGIGPPFIWDGTLRLRSGQASAVPYGRGRAYRRRGRSPCLPSTLQTTRYINLVALPE